MTLVDSNGRAVEVGETLVSFRDERARLIGMLEPRHAGSTGRVVVRWMSTNGELVGEMQTYFPGVFNLEWKE